jgi:hypothetical protein
MIGIERSQNPRSYRCRRLSGVEAAEDRGGDGDNRNLGAVALTSVASLLVTSSPGLGRHSG